MTPSNRPPTSIPTHQHLICRTTSLVCHSLHHCSHGLPTDEETFPLAFKETLIFLGLDEGVANQIETPKNLTTQQAQYLVNQLDRVRLHPVYSNPRAKLPPISSCHLSHR